MLTRPLYIFCGGGSRRMGRDKALLEVDGETLLERQMRKAYSHFDDVILLSGGNEYVTNNRQIPDAFNDAGPLSGLLAALKDVQKSHNQIAVIPVDVPFLSDHTLRLLSSKALEEDADAMLVQSDEKVQPLAGVYKSEVADSLEEFLKRGQRRVMNFLNQLSCRYISVHSDELRNINYVEDYRNIKK